MSEKKEEKEKKEKKGEPVRPVEDEYAGLNESQVAHIERMKKLEA